MTVWRCSPICASVCVSVCLNACLCGLLFESVFLFLTKHTDFQFCVEHQEAISGECETEMDITFLALGFWCTSVSWYFASPIFSSIIIQWAVASRCTSGSWSGSFSPLTHQQVWNWDDLSCAPDSFHFCKGLQRCMT
jgi:hypothetical protein